MSKLTPKQWKELQNTITLFHSVKLKVDGFDISIRMEMDSINMKLVYMVWVNNKFDGKDMDKESIIGQKFYARIYIMNPNRKFYNSMVKIFGKRRTNKEYGKPQKVLCNFSPNYRSFRTLKKVLIDNNQSIEIVKL